MTASILRPNEHAEACILDVVLGSSIVIVSV
jgi:hypothetical protein